MLQSIIYSFKLLFRLLFMAAAVFAIIILITIFSFFDFIFRE